MEQTRSAAAKMSHLEGEGGKVRCRLESAEKRNKRLEAEFEKVGALSMSSAAYMHSAQRDENTGWVMGFGKVKSMQREERAAGGGGETFLRLHITTGPALPAHCKYACSSLI